MSRKVEQRVCAVVVSLRLVMTFRRKCKKFQACRSLWMVETGHMRRKGQVARLYYKLRFRGLQVCSRLAQ